MKRHAASLVAVVAVIAGCGGQSGGGSTTNLEITAWPGGKPEPRQAWTLQCDPAGGTHPDPEAACDRLAALDDPFAPLPPDAICTEVYGGPAVAEVTGTYDGKTVDDQFSRSDGCQIARWEKYGFLFPVGVDSP